MTRLQENNIGAILDLAIEADLDAATMTGDAARVHCEQMVLSIKECVDIGARKPDSFIASKITALFPPSMLLRWSTTLEEIRRDFTSIGGGAPLSFEQFEKMAAVKPLEKSFVREMFTAASGVSKTVTFADINSIFSVHYPERLNSLVGYTKDGITAEDIETATVVMPPIYTLCRYAQEQHVKIMMDAEQTYFQPAIDDIVLGLCAKFNDKLSSRFVQGKLNGPVIFNTYQMYLKNAFARLIEDVERAQRMGYSIGAKVVRGAYMNTERKRALKNGYPSPINNTIDETHTSYNKGVTFLLETMAKNPKTDTSIKAIAFVVASHNKESEMLTCQLMDQNFIPRSGGWVGFGQLMGMQDSQTFDLAANGFMAYKVFSNNPVYSIWASRSDYSLPA